MKTLQYTVTWSTHTGDNTQDAYMSHTVYTACKSIHPPVDLSKKHFYAFIRQYTES